MKDEIMAGIQQLRKNEKDNMRRASQACYWTVVLVVLFALALLLAFWQIYLFEIQDGIFSPLKFLAWLPFVIVGSLPFILLWWILQRLSYESKTLAYGFQRKAIVEERLFHYFGDDPELLKQMQKTYLVHWMEKSPLEVMLTIGGKNKGMGGGNKANKDGG